MSSIKKLGKKFINSFMDHDLMTLSAALSFYSVLALAPLLLITLSVVGLLGESAKNNLMIQIENLMGSQASQAINAIIQAANNNPKTGGLAGLFGILILLFSASGVFAQLQSSLNVIWQSDKQLTISTWSWIRKRLLSIGMVLSLGFLGLVSLIISTILSSIFTQTGQLWELVNFIISGIIFSVLFSLIFKYLPDTKLTWRNAGVGGIVTSVLFILGKMLIGVYLGKSAVGSAYGAAGSLIVLLVWVYYSSLIVFSGAEITRIVSEKENHAHSLMDQQQRIKQTLFQQVTSV